MSSSSGRPEQSIEISRPPRKDYSLQTELRRQEYAVKEILNALQPGLEDFSLDTMLPEFDAKGAAVRGLGVLAHRDEVTAALTPDAPILPADRFHPWVWDSARTLWESPHYRQGDPNAETIQSRQRGALQLALACVALLRNPVSHQDKDLDEQLGGWSNSPC